MLGLLLAVLLARAEEPDFGCLDRTMIQEEIRRNLDGIRACYERSLKSDPLQHGKVVIRFVIGTSGEVTRAWIQSSTLGDASVESCLVARAMRFRFPALPDEATITYPFVFAPASEPPPETLLPALRACLPEHQGADPLYFLARIEREQVRAITVRPDLDRGIERCLLSAFDGYRYRDPPAAPVVYELRAAP